MKQKGVPREQLKNNVILVADEQSVNNYNSVLYSANLRAETIIAELPSNRACRQLTEKHLHVICYCCCRGQFTCVMAHRPESAKAMAQKSAFDRFRLRFLAMISSRACYLSARARRRPMIMKAA